MERISTNAEVFLVITKDKLSYDINPLDIKVEQKKNQYMHIPRKVCQIWK